MGQPQSTISNKDDMSQPQYSEPKEDETTMKQPEKIVPLQNPTTEPREGCDNQLESDLHKISNILQKMHDRAIDKFDNVSKKLKVASSEIGEIADLVTKGFHELTQNKEESNENDVVPKDETGACATSDDRT